MYNDYNVYNIDNMLFQTNQKAKIIFADYIYENLDFSWVDKYWGMLRDDGIFIAMCDYHSQHRFRVYMEDKIKAYFVNHLVQKNEWGHPPSKNFHQCYDDCIIYSKSPMWDFYSDKVQVPKITANSKKLNPSGRITKTATCWIDDCTLTTVAKERIKKDDGHLIRWQKSTKLVSRLISPFVKPGDLILDPFMGSGTSGIVALDLGCDYIGIEYDKEPFELANKRIIAHLTYL